MIDYSDTVKYDTMKVIQYITNNINRYEVRCDDMMGVHLHT